MDFQMWTGEKEHIMDILRLGRTGEKQEIQNKYMEDDTGDVQKQLIYETITFSKVGSESDSVYCCVFLG